MRFDHGAYGLSYQPIGILIWVYAVGEVTFRRDLLAVSVFFRHSEEVTDHNVQELHHVGVAIDRTKLLISLESEEG